VTPVAPTPLVEKAQSPPAQVEETAPERPPAGENDAEESEAPVKPELLPTVPFEELPAETKAEMPTIKIGLHLFSDTPASRRASINGRLVREGQAVDKDLVLVEIIRQGVVLSFQGRKFTMPVFPR
jgi:general secretion pathway protein B